METFFHLSHAGFLLDVLLIILQVTAGNVVETFLHLIARPFKASIDMAEAGIMVNIIIFVKALLSNTKTLLRIMRILCKAIVDADHTLLLLDPMVALFGHLRALLV